MTHYYVYYRVEPARFTELRPKVDVLFAAVERAFGVRGRWMRRRDDASTYMEIYEGIGDEAGFEALLARESAAFGVERKVERFIDSPPCA